MNENDGENLAIILSVIEGTGFDTRKHAIIIKAILGGNILETDAVVPGDLTASFKNKLIWSTNKEAIKRMKEENQPIKLECYFQVSENRRDQIGFVLIPLRSIPFWSIRKMGKMKPHWYKLHAVSQENKTQKPELLLSVTIGSNDDLLNGHEKNLEQLDTTKLDDEQAELQVNIIKSNANIHVQKLNNDVISIIGIDNNEQHEFVVNINLSCVNKCESLGNTLDLSYVLFSKHQFELSKNDDDGRFPVDQNISINFKSSLSDLILYFRNIFSLPIVLASGGLKSSTHLNFGDNLLTLPASVQSFQEIFATNNLTYAFDSYSVVNFSKSDTERKECHLHYTFSLKLIPYNSEHPASPTSLLLPHTTLQSTSFNKIASIPAQKTTQEINNQDEISNEANMNQNDIDESAPDTFIPKTFAYSLSLLDCIFNKRPFPGIWQLSLQHPASDSTMVIRNLEINDVVIDQISFEDMHLRLCFTSNPGKLYDLIKSKPCVLTLKGPRGVHASAELDNHNILTQEKTKGIVLLENEMNEQVAMAHISVEMEELGINFNTDAALKAKQKTKAASSGHTFNDEDFTYKMIQELEEWKISQQRDFFTELKRHEIDHLTQLSNEWQRKRAEQELKLQDKMEHCDRLTQTLEEAHNMFKERNRSDIEYEHTLMKTKSDLERCFSKKIESLNSKILQMEKENFIKQKNDEQILKEIEIERDQLKRENLKLKTKIKSLEREVTIGSMTDDNTQEQMTELKECIKFLNDELVKAKNSKRLYKERWAYIVRTIQIIKNKNSEFSTDDEDYKRLNELLTTRTDLTNE